MCIYVYTYSLEKKRKTKKGNVSRQGAYLFSQSSLKKKKKKKKKKKNNKEKRSETKITPSRDPATPFGQQQRNNHTKKPLMVTEEEKKKKRAPGSPLQSSNCVSSSFPEKKNSSIPHFLRSLQAV